MWYIQGIRVPMAEGKALGKKSITIRLIRLV